jgi:predicted ATPase
MMEKSCLLTELEVQSFKSIVDQKIALGLVNVFIGANGSGKSNILEALGVLSAAASGRVDDESLKHRGVRPGVPRLYKSAFSQRLAPQINFKAATERASYSASLNNPLEKPRPAWLYKAEELKSDQKNEAITRGPRTKAMNKEQGLAALRLVEMKPSDPRSQLLNLLRDYAVFEPNTMTLRGLLTDPSTRNPVGLSGGRLAEGVKGLKALAADGGVPAHTFFSDALEETLGMIDWIDSIDITNVADDILSPSVSRPRLILRFQDRYMRPGKNKLTAYDASEGVLYVLFCAVLALSPAAPKCVAVDNLDHALNPRLAKKLISSMCQWITENPTPRQILFTAHNPAVLDGLPLADDRVRLFAVDRNSDGHTVVNRIVITEELRRLSDEKGWPLSRLWVMGHLGGVPHV